MLGDTGMTDGDSRVNPIQYAGMRILVSGIVPSDEMWLISTGRTVIKITNIGPFPTNYLSKPPWWRRFTTVTCATVRRVFAWIRGIGFHKS